MALQWTGWGQPSTDVRYHAHHTAVSAPAAVRRRPLSAIRWAANVAKVLCVLIGTGLIACYSDPTLPISSIESRQQTFEETFWCSDLSDLQVYVAAGDLRSDSSSNSEFTLNGDALQSEPPPIVGATVGTSRRVAQGKDPVVLRNYIEFYLSPEAESELAAAMGSSRESRPNVRVQISRAGKILYTDLVYAPRVHRRIAFDLNLGELQTSAQFIPAQQRLLCP